MFNLKTKQKVGEPLTLASNLLWFGWINDSFELITNLGGFKWMGEGRPERVWSWDDQQQVVQDCVFGGGGVRYLLRGGELLVVNSGVVIATIECSSFVHVKGEFLAISEPTGVRMIKVSPSGDVLKSDLVSTNFSIKSIARYNNYVLCCGETKGVVYEVTRKMEFKIGGKFDLGRKGMVVKACQRSEEGGFWLVVEKIGGDGDGGFMSVLIGKGGG
ncbi:hypothetical protein TrLO_g8746 [Triparma laevis f. longispina]|uniref:Uncharacterized protein n=1 Tax=Triparma laevis f. longispina TaxID=1714387 RepID=A0A9W7A1V4_9STRA|nr:hypothetical protein TrLO_g8746 [Triparma laevis f. longispina]